MSRPSDYMYKMSEKLSEVMDDIGVNERLVMERTEAWFFAEAARNLRNRFNANHYTSFIFGSQIEGSTTTGLRSDYDLLKNIDDVNAIQHIGEWKPGSKLTVMMIPNENISPGHCHLQVIRNDIPIPATANDMTTTGPIVIDSVGRILLKNTYMPGVIPDHGPALRGHGIHGEFDVDKVRSYCCKSSPVQAAPLLQKLTESKWPSVDDKTFCRNAGCFLVPVGSKLSDMPKYEWRISTSLQERCLTLSLKITQLRCYVLMKMILKDHIHVHSKVKDVLSSFMCKNVLLYCVYNSSHESSQEWHTGNLLSYLHLCLLMLKECILQRNCPHLMIPGNNLLAGRMTDTQRGKLLDIIDKLMENKEELLYKIQIDDLGTRLMMKLNLLPKINFSPKLIYATCLSLDMLSLIAAFKDCYIAKALKIMSNENLEVTQQNMSELLSDLKKCRDEGNSIQQNACDHLIPLVKSALGSVMASISIDTQTGITDEAFTYLEAGKEFNVLSGSLKLASVLYCTGDIERTERELKISLQLPKVQPQPCCFLPPPVLLADKVRHVIARDDEKEEVNKFIYARCTKFMNNEINCVPHELRYEILKSYIEEDRKKRTKFDSRWMNYIAVDSVPYFYFLRYKTYGRLQRRKEQKEALSNLIRHFEIVNHKETSLNLLGQCMEQENEQALALECYIWSLQHRKRNNAARFLMCIQLMKLWKKYNV